MKFEIVEQASKDDGRFVGYQLKYRPPFSLWDTTGRVYRGERALQQVEHDICILLQRYGGVKLDKEYI